MDQKIWAGTIITLGPSNTLMETRRHRFSSLILPPPPPNSNDILNTPMNSIHSTRCLLRHRNSAMIETTQRLPMDFNHIFPSFCPPMFLNISSRPFVALAKKKNSEFEPVIKPSIVEEVSLDDDYDDIEDDSFLDEFENEDLVNGEGDFEDECFEEEAEPSVGDGAGGGGISLAGNVWDKKALEIAEEVAMSFDGELDIYAFRTLLNATIQVRIERLTNKSGSPTMMDIENFSTEYRARLDEAESAGSIPESIVLEVSSPGVERVVRIPQDLVRFKERNMYVKYITEATETGSSSEHYGIFRLICFDSEANSCTWGLADVRVNREKSGKGRPLSKKQKEWRLELPLHRLSLVRFYSEI